MKINIWNKTVDIDSNLIESYKKCGHVFNENAAMALADTSDANSKSTPKELKAAIEKGIIESIGVDNNMPNIVAEIERKLGVRDD